MRFSILLFLVLATVFFSCKSEAKTEGSEVKEEAESSVPIVLDDDNDSLDDDEEDQSDLEIFANGLEGLFSGIANPDSTQQGLFTANGDINTDFLKSEEGAPLRKMVATLADASEYEVDLIIETFPPTDNIVSVKHAREIEDVLYNPKIESHLASGEASEKYKTFIEKKRSEAKIRTGDFQQRAQQAKEEFYRLNPSWFALNETTEDTFIDSRKKMVYLPLGDLSFADSVVAFQPGKPEGRTPEKGLGPAQGNAKALKDCAGLGIGGILTLFFHDNAIIDVNGPDIYVFEIGIIEPTNLEISKDGVNWIEVGKIEGGTAFVDIADHVRPGETFNYIRFTDLDTWSDVPGADIDAVAAIGGALRLNLDSAVLFETGSHVLKSEGITAIEELALQMNSLTKGTITVEGHTDDTGSDASNKTLSKNRATSVAAALKAALNDGSFQWKEIGYGESRPIVPNDSDENRQKNRRVEILVTPY